MIRHLVHRKLPGTKHKSKTLDSSLQYCDENEVLVNIQFENLDGDNPGREYRIGSQGFQFHTNKRSGRRIHRW